MKTFSMLSSIEVGDMILDIYNKMYFVVPNDDGYALLKITGEITPYAFAESINDLTENIILAEVIKKNKLKIKL
ncbi:hypothetical protein B7C51_24785 (plasmid) [Paenibacillus larvae subsp. pulvifaciens]|uniref:Uncharacterized protein n=1 Tax=Paenibacillus larvae subsp. pulvifaciens TaxID=1477 RepID=A0A1V0UZZ6_9BACL|nr:hypothetical protein [Paenibacillus larvae]ARF70693.1 hypothetical protein B7C51_24785 [Paenibacillus larvae subsp. pulvifaciens]